MFSYLNKNLGIIFFKNPNTLNYIFFDKLYSLFILKKKNIDSEISQFHKNGFFKTKYKSLELVNYINEQIISKQEKDIPRGVPRYQFEIEKKYRKKILQLVKRDYGDLIHDLEKYYNNKIAISELQIKRNFPLDESKDYYQKKTRDKTKEPYSNYYHVDYYVGTYFKMFINLHDVYEDNGPLNIYDIKSTKEFVKENDYKSRNNYIVQDLKDKLYINTGHKGQTVIANTTKCLHRAGNVKNGQRDIIFITFGAIPERLKNDFLDNHLDYYEKQNSDGVWVHNGMFTKLSKPKGFRSTIKLFYQFIRSKVI